MSPQGDRFDPDLDGASCPVLSEGQAIVRGPAFYARWRYWARRRSVEQVAVVCGVLVAAMTHGSGRWQIVSALVAGSCVLVLGFRLILAPPPPRGVPVPERGLDWGFLILLAVATAFVAASMAGLWPQAPVALILAILG